MRELIIQLCKGNPGALNVLMGLAQYSDGLILLTVLRIKNITGSKIWELYKDRFHENLNDLAVYLRGMK